MRTAYSGRIFRISAKPKVKDKRGKIWSDVNLHAHGNLQRRQE